MIEIKASQKCSFGNGTRLAGFVFAVVSFIGDAKLFDLLKEIRDPATKSIGKLKTAKVELADTVTKRELGMVLNNPSIMKAEKQVLQQSIADLNQPDAIAAVKSATPDELAEFEKQELAGKNRKKVIEAIEKAKGNSDSPGDQWKLAEISSLGVAPETVALLESAAIKTIAEFQAYFDQHQVMPEGLTEDQTNELTAAIRQAAG